MEERFFEVKGSFFKKGRESPFTKTVLSSSEKNAKEKVLCLFGSKNKVKRRNIRVEGVKEVREE